MLVFYTKEKYLKAEQDACDHFGYPKGTTLKYSDERKAKYNGSDVWIMTKPQGVEIDSDLEIEYSELEFEISDNNII